MDDAISTASRRKAGSIASFTTRLRVESPTARDCVVALISSLLLIFSFPDFALSLMAWVGLVPLLVLVARRPGDWRSFLLGWLSGSVFFYGSCHWLTYSMIHYGGLSTWAAYLLLIPPVLAVGFFPGLFALVLARAIKRLGFSALFAAPFLWVASEWARLEVTGQLWNAIGYSQAYHPVLIQAAAWGGVYAVGFLIVFVNAAIAFALLKRTPGSLGISAVVVAGVALVIFASHLPSRKRFLTTSAEPALAVIALQPNVPMNPAKSTEEMQRLTSLHVELSVSGLRQLGDDRIPRLVIWPESPMNFTYAGDPPFRDFLVQFARANNTSVLFNSQEPAADEGSYNSAVLVNQQGQQVAQYDKIRLLPFGEYVPLPRWMPGASLIGAIVGNFTPGSEYTLMPLGEVRAGVFICIESAYPSIARNLTRRGADVLINISNDGYLGRTAVMQQHLANVILRAVENGRPVLRVTNTGITAYITPEGEVKDATGGFQTAVRNWTASRSDSGTTVYTKCGDVFAGSCVLGTLLLFGATLRNSSGKNRYE